MKVRRLIAVAAVGVLAATGVTLMGTGPASAGGGTSWPVDGQIKAKGDPVYSGIEIFGSADPGQVRAVVALPGETALFRVKVQNTRFQNNRVGVFTDFADGGLIRIKHGTVDVTDDVLGPGYRQKLGPRESFVLKVKLRPDAENVAILFHLESLKFPGGADHVLPQAGTEFVSIAP